MYSASSSVGRRVLVYTTTGLLAAVGGTVTYANYDNDFKTLANSYLPGFGEFCDRSAVGWNKSYDAMKQGWYKLKEIVLPERTTGLYHQYKDKLMDSKDTVSDVAKQGAKDDLIPTQDITPEQKETASSKEASDTSKEKAESSSAEPPLAKDVPEETKPPEPAALDDRVVAMENNLQALFEEFSQLSDNFIESLHNLAQSINTHHMQVMEATKTPKDEKEMKIIVGRLGGVACTRPRL